MAEVVQQATHQFPDDLLIEIFLRLPVRSLFLFRSVSKHWLNLIQNPHFIHLHISRPLDIRNTHQPFLILRTVDSQTQPITRKTVLTLLSDDETLAYNDDVALEALSPSMASRGWAHYDKLHLVGPCNGLFCLTDTVDVVLLNPAIRQCRNVPRSPLSRRNKNWYRSNAIDYFARVGFGFDPVSKDYKVVRFHDKKELDENYDENDNGDFDDDDDEDDEDDCPYDMICKSLFSNYFKKSNVHDGHKLDNNSDKEDDDDDDDDDAFDDSDDDDYPHDRHMKVEIFSLSTNSWRELDRVVPACYMTRIRSHNLFFNGAFHWLEADYDDDVCAILVFDLGKEDFKQFKLPGRYSEYEENIYVYLSVLNKSLALIVHMEDDCLGLDVEFEVWVMREYGVKKSWTKLYNISPDVGIKRPLSFSKKWEFLVEINNGQLALYNLKTKTIKEFQVHGVWWRSINAFRYRERLTSLK